MKKALKSKLSGPKKLVRRVLSKSSNVSHETVSQNQEVAIMTEEALSNEIGALKDQIANLKAAISTLSEETEQKEIAIAKLAREKEQLHLDLLKQKRSNVNLGQQLEEERNFYYKEKEMYCQEMNECKKLKRMMSSSSTTTGEEKTVGEYKIELLKLKQTLNQTLEANYNLSIKFLRMKNTKTCLKTELKTMKLEHEKLENDYKTKIEHLSTELSELVDEKTQTTHMSPSCKKYLQLVKQNSCLIYENLCLQLEVDNLNLKFERLKMDRTKSETNSRLKYIHHTKKDSPVEHTHRSKPHRDTKHVRIQDEAPEKLEKEPKPSCSKTGLPKDDRIVKIYERKQTPGIPDIHIINEKQQKPSKERPPKKKLQSISLKKQEKRTVDLRKQELPVEELESIPNLQLKIDDCCRQKILSQNNSKLALFQVSDMQSEASGDCVSIRSSTITRSYSSPDIVQASLFIKNEKRKFVT